MSFRSFAGLLILCHSLPALAVLDQASVDTLVSRPSRPTIEDIFSAAGRQSVLRDKSPMVSVDYNMLGASLLKAYQTTLPSVIAQFEKAYPGAVYLGLGRDSGLLSDAINAFYLEQGQSGRSKMLEMSGNTFSNNPSDETIVGFLKNYGLDLDHIDKSRPFIIFDGTRYNPQSQSRRVLSAIYRVAAQKGIDLKKLVRKINVISTCFNGYQYYPKNLISQTNLDNYFNSEISTIDKDGPKNILSVDGWYLSHGYNWTDTYGALVSKNGTISSQIGQLRPTLERASTLSNQIDVIQLTGTKQFLNHVEAESRKLGFNFQENMKLYTANAARAEPPAPKKINPEKDLIANLEALAAGLQPLGDDYGKQYGLYFLGNEQIKLTKNGYDILTLLTNNDSVQSKAYFSNATGFLADLYKKNKIGSRDFKRIFIQMLSSKKIEEPQFVEGIQKNYQGIKPLNDLLGQEKEREKFSAEGGILGQNYQTLINGGRLPISCRLSYGK